MSEKGVSEVFFAFGHENVRATHRATIEFTKDRHLSRRGDCIIAVGADKALPELSDEFRESLRKPNVRLTVTVEADGIMEQITAHGSQNLTLTHPLDMVVRKSNFADSRTLAIGADKAASDLSRKLVEKMRNPKQKTKITLTVTF